MDQDHARRVEANRELGRKFFAEQDRRKGGPSPELCAATYVARLGGNPPMDRAGHDGFAQAFYAGFEGLNHTVERVFATDDAAAVRFVIRGRHTGSFFGIPATGRDITVVANVLLQVRDGKVTELEGVFDEAGMLRQLGVLAG